MIDHNYINRLLPGFAYGTMGEGQNREIPRNKILKTYYTGSEVERKQVLKEEYLKWGVEFLYLSSLDAYVPANTFTSILVKYWDVENSLKSSISINSEKVNGRMGK